MAEVWFEARQVEAWLSGRPVIHQLNLTLELGQSTTVLGANGAGKSTLVKLIDRSLHPIVQADSHLKLFGSETVNLWQLRRRLGVVNSELETRFPTMISALEVVLSGLFGSMRLGRDQTPQAEQISATRTLLEQLDLAAIADQPFGQLSDGQRRRLMIARALVHAPEVLVLDEPTVGLDIESRSAIWYLLRQLVDEGTTVLLSSHYLEEVEALADHVFVLHEGRLLAEGTVSEIKANAAVKAVYAGGSK